MSSWRLLLTRPTQESAALAATLAQQGIYSSSLPLLAIEPLSERAEQRATLNDLSRYCAVIVVSKPAARLSLGLLQRYQLLMPTEQPWFSVGAATGQILREHGLQVHYPEHADDSEALLGLPPFQQALALADNPRVLIVRGEGGREFIADCLRSQGATVDYLPLYRRGQPDYPATALLAQLEGQQLNAVLVSSEKALPVCASWRRMTGRKWPVG